jgi:hypothetical protein
MIEVAKANLRDNAAIMSFLKPNVTLFWFSFLCIYSPNSDLFCSAVPAQSDDAVPSRKNGLVQTFHKFPSSNFTVVSYCDLYLVSPEIL